MTFQPPPPPPPPPGPPAGGPPAGPPPGEWGPPPGQGPSGAGGFDPKSVDNLDWAIMGAGFLTLIFSFFAYYSYSYGPVSFDNSAWHGFFGWFGVLLIFVSAGLVALGIFMPHVKLPVANRLAALIGWAVGALCIVLSLFIYPGSASYNGLSGSTDHLDESHGFSFWLILILALGGLVVSLMRAQQTNTAMPGPLNNMPKIGK